MKDRSPSNAPGYGWEEVYLGGNQTRENELIRKFSSEINQIQTRLKANKSAPKIYRAQHAKLLAGVTNAELQIAEDVPIDLRSNFFQPGMKYRAIVRFSNCSGVVEPDSKGDLRGVAIRVSSDQGAVQDFLLTNASASHARDPAQFMVVAKAMASRWRVLILPRLLRGLGFLETVRVLKVLRRGTSRHVESLATEQFWSRCPIAFGSCAVKYMLEPHQPALASTTATADNYLRDEFRERLKAGPVTFSFKIQRFVDEPSTPIEDVTVQWKSTAPPETLAYLVIPSQDLTTDSSRRVEESVDSMNFSPWNTMDGFRPLGSMNRARRRVYEASADYRADKKYQLKRRR